ncbi:MAG: helix-turn-helix domain containing protein [Oscillospiraceae bacterium]|nr:helix-turn-helix domain containing protein [Oscillospiraceae bacterium]
MAQQNAVKSILEIRVEQAVLIAAELFLKRGIDNVKMTDVAEAGGIGVATLYRYFGTKTTLVLRVGAMLWQDAHSLFAQVFNDDAYGAATGLQQIEQLLGVFRTLYCNHSDFLRFVHEFDSFVVNNKVEQEQLKEYEANVTDFYPIMARAYQKGCEDQTVEVQQNFHRIYCMWTHALMSMSQKFIMGDILSTDSTEENTAEIDLFIKMAMKFIAHK